MNPSILKLIEHRQPEFAAFRFADPHAQNVLVSIQIYSDRHISSLVLDESVLSNLEMDGIEKYDGVALKKGPVLPLLHHR
ncbi:hypothetical protein ABB02_00254 [Clostridiaceae bacterium JG1575]|nr:hypothetical protein ABB02_00254 [Clostridiaceae bacterium JG1575]